VKGLGGTSVQGVISGLDPGATVFALDDATEGSKWQSLHSSLGGMAQLLTNTLSTLNGVALTGQV
jgi:hypothetical protein